MLPPVPACEAEAKGQSRGKVGAVPEPAGNIASDAKESTIYENLLHVGMAKMSHREPKRERRDETANAGSKRVEAEAKVQSPVAVVMVYGGLTSRADVRGPLELQCKEKG